MNCFVVGTGRCGTSSFYQAARHIKGWTAGHESAAGSIDNYPYPDKHIEVDAQLVYRIPRLLQKYPDAQWIHLVRNRDACIRSLAVESYEVMQAFGFQWFQLRGPTKPTVWDTAAAFYDHTNELIATLLPGRFVVAIEELAIRWPEICSWLQVNYSSEVVQVFRRAYNPGVARGRDSYIPKSELV